MVALEEKLCALSKETPLRLSVLDWSSPDSRNLIRKKFNSSWFCPLFSGNDMRDEVNERNENSNLLNNEPFDEFEMDNDDAREIVMGIADEVEFYRSLRNRGNDANYLFSIGETQQTWPLFCYRRLVPLWIAQSAVCPSIAKSLYSIGFWRSDTVKELAEALSNCYTECLGITEDQAMRFRKAVNKAQADYVEMAPCWEEFGYQDQTDFEDLMGDQNPDTGQLAFRRLYESVQSPIEERFDNNRPNMPAWVMAKAKLITLVMAPAFCGPSAITVIEEKAGGTEDKLSEDSRNAQSRELRLGSGLIPLQRIDLAEEASKQATIAELNLSASGVGDGIVAVIGRREYSDHWPIWREETKKAIEDAFANKMPKTLSESLYAKLDGMIEWDLEACCDNGQREIIIKNLHSIISESIQSHSNAVAPVQPGGATRPGSILVKGIKKGKANGYETLSDALKTAAAECRIVLDSVDNPNGFPCRTVIQNGFLDTLGVFFQDQCCPKGGDPSQSLVINGVNEVSKQYAEQNPGDPSYGYLLNNLKSKLIGRSTDDEGSLRSMTKSLSFEPLCKIVDTVFDDYLEHEADIRIDLIDGNVSRRHVALFLDDGRLYACDLGSTLGTAISESSSVPADVILVGGSVTNLEPLKAASWTKDECREMCSAPLRRGNVLHIGDAAIKIG